MGIVEKVIQKMEKIENRVNEKILPDNKLLASNHTIYEFPSNMSLFLSAVDKQDCFTTQFLIAPLQSHDEHFFPMRFY